jgi:YidC/Oxa1 family membrane protein insertase
VKIQERSNEKATRNNEIYNKAGVNPMAGCIPLIQMPFDGFVSVFPSAFELRHKKFSLGR